MSRTVVIGSKAEARFDDTVALGSEAKAEHKNSVALGHASETAAAAQEDIAVINTEVDGKPAGTFEYSGFAGKASGVVSVGSAKAERQIINVAPGAITSTSTDAVNGSQLYGVAAGLNKRIDESGG
ncbi:MAG: hemagglutinin, partial [Pseudomonadaceae bacterium]|nr:hemagglutinin [Pseudomonadaceae bacterium]